MIMTGINSDISFKTIPSTVPHVSSVKTEASGFWNKVRKYVRENAEAFKLLTELSNLSYDISVLKEIQGVVEKRLSTTSIDTEAVKFTSEIDHLTKIKKKVKEYEKRLSEVTTCVSKLTGQALQVADKISAINPSARMTATAA